MSSSCHEDENHAAGANLRSDIKSFSLQYTSCYNVMSTSSESDALGPPADISLSSTLPLTASSNAATRFPRLHSAEDICDASRHCHQREYTTRRRSDWQSQEVSISTFVRRFPEVEGPRHECNHSSTSPCAWKDLPQIEHMVRAGYSRPPICPPLDLTVGRLLGCGGQAQVRSHEPNQCTSPPPCSSCLFAIAWTSHDDPCDGICGHQRTAGNFPSTTHRLPVHLCTVSLHAHIRYHWHLHTHAISCSIMSESLNTRAAMSFLLHAVDPYRTSRTYSCHTLSDNHADGDTPASTCG